jgi:hypothetical protein
MQNLNRIYDARKISHDEREVIQTVVKDFILSRVQPAQIYFFGSICTENFDSQSDVDVIVVLPDQADLNVARKSLYACEQPPIGHSIEFICVDEKTFLEKSLVGGVYFVAVNEGRLAYEQPHAYTLAEP